MMSAVSTSAPQSFALCKRLLTQQTPESPSCYPGHCPDFPYDLWPHLRRALLHELYLCLLDPGGYLSCLSFAPPEALPASFCLCFGHIGVTSPPSLSLSDFRCLEDIPTL